MSLACSAQDEVNQSVYCCPGVDRLYDGVNLTAPEMACLLKYQPAFMNKDVLDIGVGTGRTTFFLAPLARRYCGVDYSPVMVAFMQRHLPHIEVQAADFRSLSTTLGEAVFDFALATDNVLGALNHIDRLRALAEAHRVLRAGGVLAFSSHNLRYSLAMSGPTLDRHRNPVTQARYVLRYLRSLRNHRRVCRLREIHADYAVLNDRGHDFSCLHYYATRETVREQLRDAGFALLDVFNYEGRRLTFADDDTDAPSLFYVARRE